MATAGGLVFGGSNEGNFFALDATNGKPLWQFQTGGAIRSAPMSFLVDGKQHVAVAAGRGFFVFALEGVNGSDRSGFFTVPSPHGIQRGSMLDPCGCRYFADPSSRCWRRQFW